MIFLMQDCEEKLGYTFKDKQLLRQCFTHSSYSHEHGNGVNNERLEFFGDSILGYITAEYLVNKFPNVDEGVLTEYKQQLVSRTPLANAIRKSGLDEFLLFGEGEKKNVANHEAACENLFEAIVAGIYMDGGLEPTKKFVKNFLFSKTRLTADKGDKKDKSEVKVAPSDYKSLLQIYVQKNKLGEIVYTEKSVTGPPHNPTFLMEVSVGGKAMAAAKGRTKSEASKAAAEIAYKSLTANKSGVKKNNGKRRKSK